METREWSQLNDEARAFFSETVDRVKVARAPGRLDVLGGIADYSGSLVLQMPIREATAVAAARSPASTVVRARSLGHGADFELPLSALRGNASPVVALRDHLAATNAPAWAGYVVGTLAVLIEEQLASADDAAGGWDILVSSSVPEGKGVSSSAAVEVATMSALLGVLGAAPLEPPERLALMCQRVENFVVGAPCGVMDQVASALGREARLLALLCRPAEVVNPAVALPAHVRLWGLDSGVRHSVGGSDYGTVRAATFMGLALVRRARGAGSPLHHLTELTSAELAQYELPEALTGAAFLELVPGGTGDAATTVQPSTTYAVAACAAHPVAEHERVTRFAELLSQPESDAQMSELGSLMLQSHESYSRLGLGSARTDRIVELVRAEGEALGLYGAKITGGGSGGTVCVLGRADAAAEAAFRRVVDKYRLETRSIPVVFEGSSEGAIEFGLVEMALE